MRQAKREIGSKRKEIHVIVSCGKVLLTKILFIRRLIDAKNALLQFEWWWCTVRVQTNTYKHIQIVHFLECFLTSFYDQNWMYSDVFTQKNAFI